MSILHVTKIECKCERCGHEWIPLLQAPNVCPKCKSPYWNHPKKEKKLKVIKAQGPKAQGAGLRQGSKIEDYDPPVLPAMTIAELRRWNATGELPK